MSFIAPRFTRIEPGVYTWANYTIRREPTTFGMKRASNPMWFVYAEGRERPLTRRATLAEARTYVERHANRVVREA